MIYTSGRMRLFLSILFVLVALAASFVIVRLASASGEARCLVWTEEGWRQGPRSQFEDCAQLVQTHAESTTRGLQPGYWGNYAVVLDDDANVYYRYYRFGRYSYWGQLNTLESVEEEVAQLPTPEPTPVPPTPTPTVVPADPSADLDQDRIAGEADRCPDVAENLNGIFDTDGCPDSMDDLMNFAVSDLNRFWEAKINGFDVQYYPPTRVESYTAERGSRLSMNAFYSPYGHYIGYDTRLMDSALSRFGDYAPVAIMAHEFAHLAQRNLGVDRDYTISLELQADCLAGAYTFHLQEQGNLEEGDLEEGAFQMYAIGDPNGTPWFHDNAHGSGEQRYEAFLIGFENGVGNCLETY